MDDDLGEVFNLFTGDRGPRRALFIAPYRKAEPLSYAYYAMVGHHVATNNQRIFEECLCREQR